MATPISPTVQDSLQTLDARVELNLLEVLAKSYGEGFVKAVEGMEAKPQIKKDDSRLLKEDVARLTKPIQDYNKALAGKVDEIVRDSFAAGKDDMEVARILRARIPEILNNEPITIQRPGKRPVSFTADEYADIVANVVPYAVRNEGYIRGLKEAGADGWQSVAVGDERMCPMCGEKHGQVYGWDDPKPPYHVSCRCRPVAYFRKKTKEEMAESERIKAWAEEKPWETPGTPAESPDEVAEALIDDITPTKMAYPGSKIERPKLESKTLNLEETVAYRNSVASELEFRKVGRRKVLDGFSDPVLGELVKEIGYDAAPTIVSSTEIDKIVSEGHKELFRGLSDKKFADQFRFGEYYPGRGVFGNGIYTAYGEKGLKVAQTFSGISHEGSVTRMAIDKDAKIIALNDLGNIQKAMTDQLNEAISKEQEEYMQEVRKVFKMESDEADTLYEQVKERHDKNEIEFSITKNMIADPGKVALLNGYDAIDVPSEEYLVVLNRKALYIQDQDLMKDEVIAEIEKRGI